MIHLYTYLAIFSMFILLASSILAYTEKRKKYVHIFMSLYFVVWTIWIVYLWMYIERVPLKTLGETRVWYSYIVPLVAWVLFIRNGWKWIISYGSLLAVVFMILNLVFKENFSKELMPALQSVWFAPHVLVYMFAYALFGVASLMALHYLWIKKIKEWTDFNQSTRKLVYSGFSFLTLGLLFGAIWAKQAWGHYWTWDPKEVWALATWLLYMLYIHINYMKNSEKWSAYVLIVSFFILLICWFGVNYLPIAQYSVHTY